MHAPVTVIETITHMALGGAQKVALRLAEELPNHGAFQTFLVSGPGEGMYDQAEASLGDRFIIAPHLRREISPVADLRAFFELRAIYRRIARHAPGPVLVHTHAPKAGVTGPWAAACAGIRHRVHTIHGLPFNDGQSAKARFALNSFAKIGQAMVEHTISVSAVNARAAMAHRLCPEHRLTVIPPMTDAPSPPEDIAALRAELGIPADAFVAVMVASLKAPKDPLSLLKAAAMVQSGGASRRLFTVLVGGGTMEPLVRQTIADLELENDVLMTGWRGDADRFMDAADINVLLSFGEGIPLVVIDAALRGKKTIATDVGGIGEVITGPEMGWLTPVNDPGAVARALRAAMDNNDTAIPAQRRTAMEAFLPSRVTAAHAELFSRLAGR